MNLKTGLVVAGLVSLLFLTGGSAQVEQDKECVQARVWHLQQAMKSGLVKDQAYHLGAADAAGDLSSISAGSCRGWEKWAQGEGTSAQETDARATVVAA